MTELRATNLQISYGDQVILNDLSVTIPEGKITTIIGANGCGKSTLIKALSRIIPTTKGTVYLDGKAISSQTTKTVAQKLALLPQLLEVPAGIDVFDLVSYGRFPHQRGFGHLSLTDIDKINWAMTATSLTDLATQPVDSLSGGQRQKAWIAMALAQDTDLIFLDEPTTYLDLNHQLEILELLQELNQTTDKTIVMVLHDLNQASRFSDHVIAMKQGQITHQGEPTDIFTSDIIKDLFQIEANFISDPNTGRPLLTTYQLLP